MEILQNISLKPYNTFGIDVRATFFINVKTIEELQLLSSEPFFTGNKKLILGGGSNILFTKDFHGLVLKTALKGIELIREDTNHYYVSVKAGEDWHGFVLKSIQQQWQGLENLSLIPGTVGAAPIQNIGAYGVEVADYIEEVKALEIKSGELQSFNAAACKFGYRNSIFKQELKGKYLIYEVVFRLNKIPKYNITYAPLKAVLQEIDQEKLSAKHISDAVIKIRQSKLPDPEVIGNCGSFFKNPIVEEAIGQALLEKYPQMPNYAVGQGAMKIPAAWLIEQAGLKGSREGQVGTYQKQALVMVNHGNATGKEAHSFAKKIITKVNDTFGITLEPEVNIL